MGMQRTAASVYETIRNLQKSKTPFDFLGFYRVWAILVLFEISEYPAKYPHFLGMNYPGKYNRTWPKKVPLGREYCQKFLYEK